jgi:hypothetical protein
MSQQDSASDTNHGEMPVGAGDNAPNNTGIVENRNSDNRYKNNNRRDRSGSGSFQANNNFVNRGGNRNNPPQMTTPHQQQYPQQLYYPVQYSAQSMDQEANQYYYNLYCNLYQQYKSSGYEETMSRNTAQYYASQYLQAYLQNRQYNYQTVVGAYQQQTLMPMAQQYQAPLEHQHQPLATTATNTQQFAVAGPSSVPVSAATNVSASLPSAPNTAQPVAAVPAAPAATSQEVPKSETFAPAADPVAPTFSIVPPQPKQLKIQKKVGDVFQNVDLKAIAAEPRVVNADATKDNVASLSDETEKLSVETNVHQTVEAPASWENTPVLPGQSFSAPPALHKVSDAVPSSSSRPNGRMYTRQQIMDLKPAEFQRIPMYTTGVTITGDATPDSRRGAGGYRDGKGGQGGRGGEFRERGSIEIGGRGGNRRDGHREGGDEWQKERLSPKNPPTKPVLAFKKDVKDDPMAMLENDATDIINKITPETFEKLSKKTLELKVTNTAMLDTLVKLIFEAAVTQSGFSGVFADLCNFLTESAVDWNFFTVVKNADKDEYFWIKDVTFPEEFAGPFYEKSAIFEAIASNPPMKAMPGQTLTSVDVVLIDNTLVRMSKNLSEAFLITYMSFDTVPAENRSQSVFPDEQSAKKDAATQVSFRACLAQNCEREFHASVQDENLYDGVDEELRQLRALRSTMGESEFERKEQDIEEKRIKIKRRMLGNIKFVGELYKRKLLNTETMHYCITKLIGTADQQSAVVHDEQDLELLLHLLTTLGETLEQKSKKSKNKSLSTQFDQYFVRLEELRTDTKLPSRIRFAIDDLIKLRQRSWQGKKQAEGPMKISELHNKLQEDQKATAAPAVGNVGKPGPGKGAGGGGAPASSKGGPGRGGGHQDVRAGTNKGMAPGPSGGGKGGMPVTIAGRGGANVGGGNKGPQDSRDFNKKPVSVPTGKVSTDRAAAAAEPEVYVFDTKSMKGKAVESLEEYLSGVDAGEVVQTLNEQPLAFAGQLILETLEKLFNMSDANKRKKLLELIGHNDILGELTRGRDAVKQAIETHDGLKNLVDTLLDVKEAPERFASLAAALVKGNVLTASWVEDVIGRFHAHNIDQGYEAPDVDVVFDRFKSTLSKELKM